VLNAGRLEQIGTPEEIYDRPETEYVATFLGAANLLPGTVVNRSVEVGAVTIAAHEEAARFRDGQAVKLVFRPEEVCLSQTAALPVGYRRLTSGVIEEIQFVGAYERLTVRLHNVTADTAGTDFGVPITATRPKPEATATSFHVGDRVVVGLTAFRLLPSSAHTGERPSLSVSMG